MRFVRGESLKEAIDRFHRRSRPQARHAGGRAIALRQLLSRFLDVCDTMAYAHSRGVIHRDLKPANILLGPYGETLVVDWGLAKIIGREDLPVELSAELDVAAGKRLGKQRDAGGLGRGHAGLHEPEQAEGRLDLLGPASDIYSLGATLYSLLTGRPPVEDREIAVVLRKVQRGDFPPPRQVDRRVPAALEAMVLKAMELRPDDRYYRPPKAAWGKRSNAGWPTSRSAPTASRSSPGWRGGRGGTSRWWPRPPSCWSRRWPRWLSMTPWFAWRKIGPSSSDGWRLTISGRPMSSGRSPRICRPR